MKKLGILNNNMKNMFNNSCRERNRNKQNNLFK